MTYSISKNDIVLIYSKKKNASNDVFTTISFQNK